MLGSAFLEALSKAAGDGNVLTDPAECWPYGYDNSRLHVPPEAVVFATSHTQVREIMRLCNEHAVPLTPRGRGTGTTGGSVPVCGGLVISMERMDRILEVSTADRLMVVQAGVTNQAVQDAAATCGFFWPPDPTSAAYCTVGGNLAFNSAGPRAVKYGTPRENTLGLSVVIGAGEALRTGVRTTKGVVGLDLTRLLIGSEGQLAIITEATLRLTPLPEAKRSLRAVYVNVEAATCAVSAIMAQPVVPCALEFIDGTAIDMIRSYSRADLPADGGALLMIEVDGAQAHVDSAAEAVAQAARVSGCLELKQAHGAQEIADLWATRKALSPALRNVAPGKINEDVVVPVSHMAELIGGLQALGKAHDITIVNFGHAGNGNIHVNLLIDPHNAKQMRAAERCLDEVFSLVLALDGTLSGEHGVGISKRDFITRELDPVALRLMRAIKRQFDPKGILNPDKVLPDG
ncbi:MAG TPA: FAD-linked oxidase C-terminal domain-containing protein [Gammaproteobacteria bacterium]|nr:FAD-linked oxidase C-terminal domain-containing protein [Gammaproteobacteria bacterium]